VDHGGSTRRSAEASAVGVLLFREPLVVVEGLGIVLIAGANGPCSHSGGRARGSRTRVEEDAAYLGACAMVAGRVD
jgi:hypothetical protein